MIVLKVIILICLIIYLIGCIMIVVQNLKYITNKNYKKIVAKVLDYREDRGDYIPLVKLESGKSQYSENPVLKRVEEQEMINAYYDGKNVQVQCFEYFRQYSIFLLVTLVLLVLDILWII